MAAWPALGLLVTSSSRDNTLNVFALPGGASSGRGGGAGGGGGAGATAGARAGLARVCTLGGVVTMRFEFREGGGYVAFTDPASSGDSRPLLLVTDAGLHTVHVIDVVGRVHVGYVVPPGLLPGPRGVATRGSLAAVSAWKQWSSGGHVVQLYQGSGSTWSPLRVIGGGFGAPGDADGQLRAPYGLRFTADGTGLVVAGCGNGRVSQFVVGDGSFDRHVAGGLLEPWDVEEVEGGWLVACAGSNTVEFVDGEGGGAAVRATLGKPGSGDGELQYPSALALVPGLGLVVREFGNARVQVFATPDDLAMGSMSAHRVGWMLGVVRAVAHRRLQAPVAPWLRG